MALSFIDTSSNRSLHTQVRAVLLDLDGTLFDTFPIHWEASNVAARHFHPSLTIPWDVYLEVSIRQGKKITEILPSEIPAPLFYTTKDKVFRELAREKLNPNPGVQSLLNSLVAGNTPFSLVTTARRTSVESLLRTVWNMPFPQGVVTFDDVSQTKPHPEPYIAGSNITGTPPEFCIAIEDSPFGAQSAIAAGVTCLILDSPYFDQSEYPQEAIPISNITSINLTQI